MERTVADARLRGLGAIAHPVAVVALLVLVLHDVLVRPLLPALLAGKVSDVAGLVVFPLVLAAMLAVWLRDDDTVLLVATSVTVVWFAGMKVLAPVATTTIRLAEVVTPRAAITPDVTDLLALPAVLVAAWIWRHRVPRRAWATPVLVLAVLWSSATSCLGPPVTDEVVALDDGSFVVDIDGRHVVVHADGALGDRLETLPQGLSEARARVDSVCLADGTCIRAAGHDLVEVGPDGQTTSAVDIPEGRFAYAERAAGGCGPTEFVPALDMAANASGVVVVAHGSHGVSIRAADGTWSRPDVGGTSFTGPPPEDLVVAAFGLSLLGWLLALWPTGGLRYVAGITALVVGGAVAAVLSIDFLLLVAVPALLVALVVLLGLLAFAGAGMGARRLAAVATPMAVATGAACFVVWAWAAGWVASAVVATIAVVLVVALPTASVLLRGRARGTWPVPERGPVAFTPRTRD